jgi:hypothetical protein
MGIPPPLRVGALLVCVQEVFEAVNHGSVLESEIQSSSNVKTALTVTSANGIYAVAATSMIYCLDTREGKTLESNVPEPMLCSLGDDRNA